MRSDISYGIGMYKSTDGGATWSHIGLEDSRQISRILVDPQDPNRVFVAALGHAYSLSGERDKANKILDELREMSKQRYVSPYLIAIVYVGLGDKDQAFAWLDKAFQDRSSLLLWLKVEPQFDSLRDDPRFQDLLRRVGLTP